MEDGYAVLLSAGSIARFAAGLRAETRVVLRSGANGRTLAVSVIPSN